MTLYNNSGIPQGNYTYTTGMNGNTDPSIADKGPTPPGNYYIDPSELSPAGFFRKYFDPRDWGDFRIALHPTGKTNTYGRGELFMHGGHLRPGSEGCLKVDSQNQNDLFKQIGNNTGIIPVTVLAP